MATWRYGNMTTWQHDNMTTWQGRWQNGVRQTTKAHRVLRSDRDNLTVTHSLAHSLLYQLARWNNSLTHSHIKTVKSWLLDVLERNHSLSAEYKKTGGCAEKGCSTTNRCTWITLLSCHSSTPKKLVNKLNKVPPTSLSKNIERKVDSSPFNLEQTEKIRFLWKVVWFWF